MDFLPLDYCFDEWSFSRSRLYNLTVMRALSLAITTWWTTSVSRHIQRAIYTRMTSFSQRLQHEKWLLSVSDYNIKWPLSVSDYIIKIYLFFHSDYKIRNYSFSLKYMWKMTSFFHDYSIVHELFFTEIIA